MTRSRGWVRRNNGKVDSEGIQSRSPATEGFTGKLWKEQLDLNPILSVDTGDPGVGKWDGSSRKGQISLWKQGLSSAAKGGELTVKLGVDMSWCSSFTVFPIMESSFCCLCGLYYTTGQWYFDRTLNLSLDSVASIWTLPQVLTLCYLHYAKREIEVLLKGPTVKDFNLYTQSLTWSVLGLALQRHILALELPAAFWNSRCLSTEHIPQVTPVCRSHPCRRSTFEYLPAPKCERQSSRL